LILIVDTYAWIEFLAGSPQTTTIQKQLGTADVVVTPDIVLAELCRKLERDGVEQNVLRRKVLDVATLSEVASISIDVALGVFAAGVDLRTHAKKRHLNQPGLSDEVILSFARVLGGKVLTGDRHFQGLPETVWVAA